MSAPTPAPGDDRPREGYYPDPSIPGYVRYWNGAAWVPGTSRPAPADGAPLAPPPGSPPAQPSVEETGPHFFDEDPAPSETDAPVRPEPAAPWDAAPQRPDPRVPHAPAQPDGESGRTDGTTTIPPAAADGDSAPTDGTFVFRRPGGNAPVPDAGGGDDGTMTFRAVKPRPGQQSAATPSAAPAQGSPGFGAGKAAAARAAAGPAAAPAGPQRQPGAQPGSPSGPQPGGPSGSQLGGPSGASSGTPAAPAAASVPQQAAAPAATPVTSGVGGGQTSWAQQVHRLAGVPAGEQPVAPWKPPVDDPFQAAARRQAAARPAAVGRRLAARLIDTVVVGGLTAVAAVPLGARAADHVQDKIDQAKLSGQTVTVWLLDGTTAVLLGGVLGVLLVAGVLFEALPTAKWGRTLGKKLLGIEVRDIEAHEPPSFGAALRRWLVYCVPGLLVFGVIGVVWGLFDRPWRQCWHDKAAHTFVAG
ncbi:RDD family protein [Streptomyces sp. B93]|uniref:RDD family protein n=1 Tax=Streptomyces sp. B93 TaxID=2824875 RepID=UPI001B3649AE|nr:RDD family protein [Streptomyces sp. B93]MBQ1092605.1 RDD family protein [Streptomyces sp. B93]